MSVCVDEYITQKTLILYVKLVTLTKHKTGRKYLAKQKKLTETG